MGDKKQCDSMIVRSSLGAKYCLFLLTMVCEVLSHIGFRAERSFFASTSPMLLFCFQYLLFSIHLYSTSVSSSQIHLMVSLPSAEISANSMDSLAKDQLNLVLTHFSLIIFCYFLTFHPLSS